MADAQCTWSAVPGVDGYNLYLKSNGSFVKQNSALITATEYLIEEIADGTYEAYATSVLGNKESEPSNVFGFQVPAPGQLISYNEKSLSSMFWNARPLAIETTDNLFVPGYAKLAGTDSERGILQYNKAGNTFTYKGLQEINVSDRHFAPTGFAVTGGKVFVFAGWWGGSGDPAHQNDYVSYWVSDANEDVSAFSAEKQLSFSDVVGYDVTVAYPNFIRTAGLSMVLCRLPQASSNRDWGFRVTDQFPFEPGDFDPTRVLIDTSRWHYMQPFVDTVDSNIVHFYTRDHSGGFKTDGKLHYFYMNFNTGKVIGKNGEVGDINTGAGLPMTQAQMWEVYAPLDWAFAGQPFTSGAPSAANPVRIPFYNRDGSTYQIGVATLSKAAGESGNNFTASLLGVTADNFIIGSAQQAGEKFILINQSNSIKAVVSNDNYATHTVKSYGVTVTNCQAFMEVLGGLSAQTKMLALRGTLESTDWTLTLINIDLENFS